jgi:hypothetical protein
MLLRVAAIACAVALVPVTSFALGPPHATPAAGMIVPATQSIDPCYKKCFLDAKGKSNGWKFACRRACNASPKKKCQDKCFSKLPNEPTKRKACLSRCS